MASRMLSDLEAGTSRRVTEFIAACRKEGIELLVTATYRSPEEQDKLYAQGRTTPGNKVTNARGGESFHNCRRACDVVPTIHGKPVWDDKDPLWTKIGLIAARCDLEWGGLWKFMDKPHVQYRGCEKHGLHEKATAFSPTGACLA